MMETMTRGAPGQTLAGNLSLQEIEDLESDYRMAKRACMGGFACFSVSAVLLATVLISMPASPLRNDPSLTTGVGRPARGALVVEPVDREPYSCRQSLLRSAEWPFEKKAYCCAHYRLGCPEGQRHQPARVVAPAPTPAPGIFDCRSGFTYWREMWTVEKKAWCCAHFYPLGCEITTPAPFVCQGPVAGAMSTWSDQKRTWCCEEKEVGCSAGTAAPAPATATSAPARVVPATSSAAPTVAATTAAPTTAAATTAAAATAAPSTAAATTAAPSAASTTAAPTAAATTAAPTTAPTTAAPTAAVTSAPTTAAPTAAVTTKASSERKTSYDCQADSSQWKEKWSKDKQDFCCVTFDLPCGPNAAPSPAERAPSSKASSTAAPTTAAPTTAAPTTAAPAAAAPAPAPAKHQEEDAGEAAPCAAKCEADGMSSSCGARMRWAAAFLYPTEDEACPMAQKSVTKDCSQCASCTAAQAKCVSQNEVLKMVH